MTLLRKAGPFKGIMVGSDDDENPFFRTMVVEDLQKIASQPRGKALLNFIAEARPASRTVGPGSQGIKDVSFPGSTNVVILPTTVEFRESRVTKSWGNLVPSGDASQGDDGCVFRAMNGSVTIGADTSFSSDGRGTVAVVRHSNVIRQTSKGEATYSFIILAHELIHALHHLTGTRKDGGDEETSTTGIGKFANEPLSENRIRQAFGVPLRAAY